MVLWTPKLFLAFVLLRDKIPGIPHPWEGLVPRRNFLRDSLALERHNMAGTTWDFCVGNFCLGGIFVLGISV